MALTEPDFIQRDPQLITAEIIADYERMTGKTLYPAQVDRLLIDVIAYRETLVRVGIQEAAKQNLVAFARAPMLDYLGELVGVTRLPAQAARATFRFQLMTARSTALLIPAGTQVETSDGVVTFATEADVVLAAGQLFIDVVGVCDAPGVAGNGWQIGKISSLVDDLGDDDVTVGNISVPSSGVEEELNDRLRERIKLAPEAFSTAGSKLAYLFHAKSAHQSIKDVAVRGPKLAKIDGQIVSLNDVPPGEVRLYPLLDGGLPDQTMLALVEATCSAERVRPLCDFVQALPPIKVEYQIVADVTLQAGADQAVVLAQVRSAAEAYAADRAAGLGRDVVPQQIIAKLQLPGVYSAPVSSPALLVLDEHEWAYCTGIDLRFAGVANG
ncbi:baseplate J/gp47 family protein [Jeongeupia wiesaeckerbachi]|uniref:baseplate assembly protein n=1 Tax=Jeongeupia wiesaeckerbachi TaxID=3051218 RepID=UPI003D80882C